jgi:hypothetical protein
MTFPQALCLLRAFVGHRLHGSPIPPPHAVKVYWLRRFQKRYRTEVFVETGTYYGASVDAMLHSCRQIYTIELDPELWAQAQRRFSDYPHVHVIHGDSGQVLMALLPKLTARSLFWLDGHFSGAGTARTPNRDTPIQDELAAIGSHHRKDHVILIDDARLFDGSNGYPHVETLRHLLSEINPDYTVRIVDDMIQAYPPESAPFRAR